MSVFPESRLSIITLGVTDRAAMTAFYADVLGMKRFGPADMQMTMMDMGGFVLGLWEHDKLAKDAGIQDTGPNTDGFRGLALAYNARTREEVDGIFARLAEANVTITTPPHEAFWGGYSGYFTDPEGNAWEVAFNPFWTIDETGRLNLGGGE